MKKRAVRRERKHPIKIVQKLHKKNGSLINRQPSLITIRIDILFFCGLIFFFQPFNFLLQLNYIQSKLFNFLKQFCIHCGHGFVNGPFTSRAPIVPSTEQSQGGKLLGVPLSSHLGLHIYLILRMVHQKILSQNGRRKRSTQINGMREHIAEIVEGTKEAFKKRKVKYGFTQYQQRSV